MKVAAFFIILIAIVVVEVHAQSSSHGLTIQRADSATVLNIANHEHIFTCGDNSNSETDDDEDSNSDDVDDDDDFDFYVIAPPDTQIECAGDPRANAPFTAMWSDPNLFGYGYEGSACHLGWCDDDNSTPFTDDDDDVGVGSNQFLWEENNNRGGWQDSPEQLLCGSNNWSRVLTRTWFGMHTCGDDTNNIPGGGGNCALNCGTTIPPGGCPILNTCIMDPFQVIAVVDSTAPYLNPPPDITVECGTPINNQYLGSPLVEDNCWNTTPNDMFTSPYDPTSVGPNLAFAPVCGSSFGGPGSYVRRWTVSDGCNPGSAQQNVVVQDTVPPYFQFVQDQVFQCSPVVLSPLVEDSCTRQFNLNAVTLTNTLFTEYGRCIYNYKQTYTYTATDCSSNTAEAVVNVFVDDTVPPVWTNTGTGAPAVNLFKEVICKDNVDPIPTLTASDNCPFAPANPDAPIMQTFPPATDVYTPANNVPGDVITTRKWVAEDQCGNVATVEHSYLVHLRNDLAVTLLDLVGAGGSVAAVTRGVSYTMTVSVQNIVGPNVCPSEGVVVTVNPWPAIVLDDANSFATYADGTQTLCFRGYVGPGDIPCPLPTLLHGINPNDDVVITLQFSVPTSHVGDALDIGWTVTSTVAADPNLDNNFFSVRIPIV